MASARPEPSAPAPSAPGLEVETVAPAIGAEIRGVDLSRPLDDATFAALHDALMEHHVLFFRDQDITPGQQVAFGRRFGELHVHPFLPRLEEHPEVIVLENDEARRPYTDRWHTDVTFERTPPLGSILHAQIVPASGGDTLWASTEAAYEDLSGTMQRFLSGLTAVHDFTHNFGQGLLFSEDGPAKLAAAREANPPVEHPVVRTHPVTKRKCLFVNPVFTAYVKGLRPAESESLLAFLYAHAARPEFQVRFRWRERSLAFWDNRCTQHYALADYWPQQRRMHRVTVIGDEPC